MFNAGIRGKRANDNQGTVNPQTQFVQSKNPQPYISGYTISGTDDTALDPAGGQTVLVNGTGFATGVSATVGGTQISVVTLVSPTQISFTSPAKSAGSYSLVVYNSSGGAGILVPGLTYSSVPTYTTAAGSIGSYYETTSISTSVVATSDSAITYSLASGSLPSGASLSSGGVITGTSPVDASSTTYTFAITATDAELQDVTRTFTLTINTDVVSWSSPADNTTYNVFTDTSISNVAMSATSAAGYGITYTANALPTGLSISGANIAGTPTVAANSSSLITATASTTNRTATRTINWVIALPNDVYFKNTTLLLNGETTVTPFISDASTNSLALTIYGDTKPTLFDPYTPGYYSNYFDGTGDYLQAPSNASFQFGTADFTIEAWVYMSSGTSGTIFDNRTSISSVHPVLYFASGTTMSYYAGSTRITSGSYTFLNKWVHVAVCRASGSTKLFFDGVQTGSTYTDANNFSTSGTPAIGASYNAISNILTGYISNLRVVKGTALYTTAFTPPTSPLTAIANTSLLTCQSNRLIDNSTNAFTITKNGDVAVSPNIPFTANASYSTYGSAYFDGTGDYLTVPNSSAFALPGDFTIECWVYMTTVQTCVFAGNINTSGYGDWAFFYNSASGIRFLTGNGTVVITGTYTMPANAWVHCAISRSGSSVKIFANGVLLSTTTDSNSNTFAGTMQIGRSNDGGMYLVGYMADIRIVKGTALYTTTFTPPTSLLTAIANTQLLTLQYNGGATNQAIIDNSNFNNIITRNGNTSQGTFSPYSVTGWSNYFNGSTDYLTTSATKTQWALIHNGSDWTVETWLYYSSTTLSYILYNSGSTTTYGFRIFYNSSTDDKIVNIRLYNNGSTFTASSSASLIINQWNYVAITYTASTKTINFYINGSNAGNTTTSGYTPTNNAATNNTSIGGTTAAANVITGYLSNLRVSSVVRTGLTTIPTSPLVADAYTFLLTCQSNRFVDNSPNNFAITLGGTPSVQALDPFGSISEATPLSYSNYFDGSTDYISYSGGPSIGTGAFTIECWVNIPDYTAGPYILGAPTSSGTSLEVNLTSAAVRIISTTPNTVRTLAGFGSYFIANTWNHIVLTRDSSGNLTAFVNGVKSTTGVIADNNNYSATGTYIFARLSSSTSYFSGYISNLRVVVGTNVYDPNAASITVPTSPLTAVTGTSLLTCQSTTIKDNSTNGFTLTSVGSPKPLKYNPFGYTAQTYTSYTPSLHGGSAYFDGTGDYLSIPYNSIFNFGTSNFTIEFWVYFNSIASAASLYVPYSSTYGQIAIVTGQATPGTLYCFLGTAANTWDIPAGGAGLTIGTVKVSNWYHVSVVRNGSIFSTYLNGTAGGTATSASALYSLSSTIYIGYDPTIPGGYLNGYMSDLRITKGTAVYTSNFVPPAQTLTNYSTTYPSSLLLNFNNGGIIDQHSSNVLETLGNAQLSTAVKKYGNASLYFDGASGLFSGVNIAVGTGDFTYETWVYPTVSSHLYPAVVLTASSLLHLFGLADAAAGSLSSLKTIFGASTRPGSSNSWFTAPAISQNVWTHLAFVRSGTTISIYVNGVSQTITTTNQTNTNRSEITNVSYIGRSALGEYLTGYLDDLRITKGYARYTANFTAPTTALLTK